MTKFYAGFSFPNGSGLASLIHSFFFPSLSASITVLIYPVLLHVQPEFPANFTFSTFFSSSSFLLFSSSFLSPAPPRSHFLPSLGIGGNLERCRLMTAETCIVHNGLVSGNTPGIQTRTSDILFFSVWHRWALSNLVLSCFKSHGPGKNASKCPIFLVNWKRCG